MVQSDSPMKMRRELHLTRRHRIQREGRLVLKPPSKPDIYCPKEKKRVPIWWCLGSYVQQKEQCPELIEAEVNFPENRAEVRCGAKSLG